jgi:MFS family permease
MSITMRGGEQPFLDLPPTIGEPGRHRTARRRAAGYRAVFAVREFRTLWWAQAMSYLGDQVAQVAIAVLVYAKTGSAWLTALAYTLTYLPPIVGGPLLAGLADMFPRRHVMITLDLVRGGLVELMALPSVPLAGTCALLFVTVLLGPPFSAARTAMLPQILPRDRLALGSAVGNVTFQTTQAAGFLVGGILVATLGAYRALALDALSFCLSAALITGWVRPRPEGGRAPARPLLNTLARDVSLIFQRPAARTLVLFGWLAGFAVVPEGLAAPYARTLGGGPLTVGVLMGAMPAGTVAGALVIGRLSRPDERLRMIGVLAMLSCAPLIASLLRPPLPVLVLLLMLAGAGGAYQLAAARAFVRALPNGQRGRAFGVAQSGLLAAQGLGILAAGAAARWISPPTVVAIAGALGLAAAAVLAAEWARHRSLLSELASGRHLATTGGNPATTRSGLPGAASRAPATGEAGGGARSGLGGS